MSEILKSVSSKSADHEFYTPIPKRYKKGKTKYVIVLGTVMSGLGKGVITSSLSRLLKNRGLKVAPAKFDGYLNQDAGTLNPYRHGEVFVLDDGTETDMDLGNYERMLDCNLSKDNYLTGGKVFSGVLKRERKGGYLGRDVQFIPHVTGEVKQFLRNLALKEEADVVLFEVGGTVGDLENGYCVEAMRQLMYEEGKENVCFVALTYILEPNFLGEQKSKAAQLGFKTLMSMGIQPDIIACRAQNPVTQQIREKISVYSNVPVDNVISLHDAKSIYLIPDFLKEKELDIKVLNHLNIEPKQSNGHEKEWKTFIEGIEKPKKEITIGITGKYTSLRDSYASILKAIEHSGAWNKVKVNVKWIETTKIDKSNVTETLKDVKGIIVPGGFGKRGTEGKIACIKYARENKIPYLGLCYGFQMAVVEFARNVCGIKDANSTEIDPDCANPIIDILPEQKKIEGLGGNMRLGGRDIEVKQGSIAHKIYGNTMIRERFRHRYEVNPIYIEKIEEKGMIFSGKAPLHPIMQILELSDHPYFVGSQFHPEFTSHPTRPSPLFLEFIKAAIFIN